MPKLREGKEYKFLVEKELTLPDNSHHFLLKGPDSKKYLIPISRYSHYGILTGKVIKCKVDRINCMGKVFLEPLNPWYSEGKSYSFDVDGIEERIDNTGTNRKVIVVTDKSGTKICVPHDKFTSLTVKGEKIILTVIRITKGKVHFGSTSGETNNLPLEAGSDYEFVVERIEKGIDDEEYFVIKDPFGNFSTLPAKYYKYYGYTTGTRFRGKIIRNKKNGGKTIEPENPFYKSGSEILMRVTSFYKNPVNHSFTINLKDKYSFSHCIETSMPPNAKSVRCKVLMIKKGKPLLEIL
jgi:hypothetical protein